MSHVSPRLRPRLGPVRLRAIAGACALAAAWAGPTRVARAQAPGDDAAANAPAGLRAADANAKAALEDVKQQYDKVKAIYSAARSRLGNEHTLLAPAFYGSRKRVAELDGSRPFRSGVAGLVMVPLFGAGGGHGRDWWPVLSTKAAEQVYGEFEKVSRRYLDVLERLPTLVDNVDTIAHWDWRNDYAQIVVELLRLYQAEEGDELDKVKQLLQPALLAASSLLGRQQAGPQAGQVRLAADAAIATLRSTLCRFDEIRANVEGYCQALGQGPAAAAVGPKRSMTLAAAPAAPSREDLVKVDAGSSLAVAIVAQTKQMSGREDRAASGPPVDAPVHMQRHNLLIGPTLGVPLTQNPTDLFLFGGALEVGGESFRLTAGGGLTGAYQGATASDILAQGWFVSIGISGEFGDDLFHFFNGGADLVAKIAGAHDGGK